MNHTAISTNPVTLMARNVAPEDRALHDLLTARAEREWRERLLTRHMPDPGILAA